MRTGIHHRVSMRGMAAAVVTVVLFTSTPAQAFFWIHWPGSRIKVPDTLTPGPEPGNPPTTGGGPGGGTDPGPGPDTPDHPGTGAPEPSTLVAGAIGLAAMGVARWRKRMRNGDGATGENGLA